MQNIFLRADPQVVISDPLPQNISAHTHSFPCGMRQEFDFKQELYVF
jgi:hypothetical protein